MHNAAQIQAYLPKCIQGPRHFVVDLGHAIECFEEQRTMFAVKIRRGYAVVDV
jgi:hypothetical protein